MSALWHRESIMHEYHWSSFSLRSWPKVLLYDLQLCFLQLIDVVLAVWLPFCRMCLGVANLEGPWLESLYPHGPLHGWLDFLCIKQEKIDLESRCCFVEETHIPLHKTGCESDWQASGQGTFWWMKMINGSGAWRILSIDLLCEDSYCFRRLCKVLLCEGRLQFFTLLVQVWCKVWELRIEEVMFYLVQGLCLGC